MLKTEIYYVKTHNFQNSFNFIFSFHVDNLDFLSHSTPHEYIKLD